MKIIFAKCLGSIGLYDDDGGAIGIGFSDMLHKLWIEKGESCKLVLIQIHHKDFVSGRQIRLFRGELPIEIAHIFAVALE